MQIVVLDGFTLNPGDLSWDSLHALGPCTAHDRTPTEQIVERAAAAQVVLTNKAPLSAETLARLPQLRYIGVLAAGHNIVDGAAARRRDIVVTNAPDYSTRSVAQLAMAHLLNLAWHVGHHAATVDDGRWSTQPDFCYWDFPLIELDGLVLGILGFGRIGGALARMAQALGMHVQACTRRPASLPPGVAAVGLEELFRTSDVLSLHCPLTPKTQSIVNREHLAWMKPTALLLNTSRGPLIDEPALAEALESGRLAGAGLDVLSVEPPPPDHPLLRAKNCYITPHIGWATLAARRRLLEIAVGNVQAFLAGQPRNVVN